MVSRIAHTSSHVYENRFRHLARLSVHDHIGKIVQRGLIAIDDDELRPCPFRDNRHGCGGVDDEGRAYHDEEVGRLGASVRLGGLPFRHCLAERDGGRLEEAAACLTPGRFLP